VGNVQNSNRTTVRIYGQEYTIVGQEDPQHILNVAKLVDTKMKEIKQKSVSLDAKQLAVLTAVNIVNDYLKIKDELTTLKQDHKKEES
jgi:cell division protein ZapA